MEGATSVTRKPGRAGAGFSLIELIVVISIIVIVSAATIPLGLNFVRQYKIAGAAQNIAAQVQRARSQAVKRNSSRGILLNFNYPAAGDYQFTSLDPDPRTGDWDGGVYPSNPGVYDRSAVNYGTVPTPPNNTLDPNAALGVQSPHGVPEELPQSVQFEVGERNALLFRADGSIAAVNAGGSVGAAALRKAPNGVDWLVTVRDVTTNLSRTLVVTPGGRIRVETP
jgi:prepilin-type N-terminal cleavage/methylation domain-containing protein